MGKYGKTMTLSGNAGKVSDVKLDDKGRRIGKRNGKPVVLITPNDIAVMLGLDKKSGGKRVRGLLRGVEVGNDKTYTRWQFDANAPETETLIASLATAIYGQTPETNALAERIQARRVKRGVKSGSIESAGGTS